MLESRRYIHVRKNYFTLKNVLLYSVVLLFLARHEEVPIMLHRAKIMVSSKSNRVNQCIPGAYKAWVREFFQKPGGSQSSSITAKSQPNLDDDFPVAAQMEFHLQLSSHTLFTCQQLLKSKVLGSADHVQLRQKYIQLQRRLIRNAGISSEGLMRFPSPSFCDALSVGFIARVIAGSHSCLTIIISEGSFL